MDIFLAILLFAVGIIIIVKGADMFVNASSWLSDVTGISKVLIGATIVAVATSGPELFVSLIASLQGKVDMSIGNVIGSHLCNLGLGFSLIAIFRPAKNTDKLFLSSGFITLLTAALLLIFCFVGFLSAAYAVIFFLVYAVFTFINIRYSEPEGISDSLLAANDASACELSRNNTFKTETSVVSELDDANGEVSDSDASKTEISVVTELDEVASEERDDVSKAAAAVALETVEQPSKKRKRIRKPTNKKEIIINVLKFTIGLVAIIFGSKLIVDNATVLARVMGVSELFIGLTIVAVGTSLPEIVTTIAAIVKKESDLGIGNIFGSCVFNNTFIVSVAAFVTGGLTFASGIMIDVIMAIALTLVSVLPTVIGKKIYRWQGIVLIASYIGYIAYIGIAG